MLELSSLKQYNIIFWQKSDMWQKNPIKRSGGHDDSCVKLEIIYSLHHHNENLVQLSQCTLLPHLAGTSRRGSSSTSWVNRSIIAIILIIIPLHTFQMPNKQRDSALKVHQQHAGIARGMSECSFVRVQLSPSATPWQICRMWLLRGNPLVLSGLSCGRDSVWNDHWAWNDPQSPCLCNHPGGLAGLVDCASLSSSKSSPGHFHPLSWCLPSALQTFCVKG